ncbi:hypothetical protein AAP84_23900 [Salmonella enterica subsp. enterica]|nr:hypothetical protein [Salmonella enterica subsp. enterica serovar Litchfield]
MVDLDKARQFLAAEFESAGLPHAAGSILAGISPFGKGAYIAAIAAALSTRHSQAVYHGDVDLKWLSGSIGEVAHRLSTYMPTGLAEWADRARDCRIASQVLSELAARQLANEPVAFIAPCELDSLRAVKTHRWLPTVWSHPTGQAGVPLYAAPSGQAVDVSQAFRNLVAAAKCIRDRVVETRGVKCMDNLDHAIDEADKALLGSQAVGHG